MSLTDGIVELRQKGASDRLSRELLASVNVAVRTDTITRFLAEVADKPPQRRTRTDPADVLETTPAAATRHGHSQSCG